MLRPQACRWFELVATRAEVAPLLERLAATGAVELQAHEGRGPAWRIPDSERLLERYAELRRSHAGLWPPPAATVAPLVDPAAALAAAVRRLEAWQADAEPLRRRRELALAQSRRLDALAQVAQAARAAPGRLPEPSLLATAGRFALGWRLVLAPRPLPALPAGVIVLQQALDGATVGLIVGPAEALPGVDAVLDAAHALRLDWPPACIGRWDDAAAWIAAARADADRDRAATGAQLQALAARHGVAQAEAEAERVAWLVHHGPALAAGDRLLWVTGWTTAADAAALQAPLQRAGLATVLRFAPPPDGAQPPAVLVNPRWARGFEPFARLLGPPAADEADPSALLAGVAPLLFGFMFGDLGQGALLLLAGLVLRRRHPALALLVPGGLSAMFFGALYGSVFAREDLLPALWLHPLQHPVNLLLAALALGAAILFAGLALNALQAVWQQATRRWWAQDAPLLLAYAGALAAAWWPAAGWAVAAGALWAALGGAGTAGRRLAGVAGGLAHFVEQALQLAVNTVSFARVGAFALAHAGLSAAVVGIADASDGIGAWIVLALGNLLILALEGLVVGIQTTRLLLFEFFLRFLRGQGRAFRPLPPPPVLASP